MPQRRIYKYFLLLFSMFFISVTSLKPLKTQAAANHYAEGKAECVMEINSRRILYESNGDLRLPMASTTKILTAITVIEQCNTLNEVIKIPQQAEGVEGSSVYLKSGEEYTVEELLYGLMLRSGNDCAVALAMHCSGSITDFSSEMNRVAQSAGALNSNFKNPHGLPCDGHYTTARDLSLISCYAMQNPIFAKIVSTKYFEIRNWKNKNKMLSLYEGGIGIKTGYTKQAGRCLVSAAEKGNMRLVCTVLNCPTTYERSTVLLNDAFNSYEYTLLIKANTPLKIDETDLLGYTKEDFYYPLLQEEKELIEIQTFPYKNVNKKKIDKEIVGQFKIFLSKRLLFSGNLYKL